MKNILIAFSLIFSISLQAQENFTLSGYLKDGETGEELLYATVQVVGTSQATTTNLYGFYSLTLPAGNYDIQYSYVGFKAITEKITLDKDIRKDIELSSDAEQLGEIVVEAEKQNENITNSETGTIQLSTKEMKKIPVIFGEQDILKTIQLMPGVSSAGEGSSGFFVRGGNTDQNLILLDEAPVYNASHLLGFFSVFNSDALKDMKLYKGNIPAEYGGRLSSVLDVRMKEGNMKDYTVSGGIGLISSRATIEGPIVEDKGSFIVSGRRTYADVMYQLYDPNFEGNLYFYDLNAKANYKITENDRIYMSGYFGRDALGLDAFGVNWGNATGTLRWNHLYSDKLFSNTSLIYSDYDYEFGIDRGGTSFTVGSGIQDWNLKQDFTYYPNTNNTLKFGVNAIYHTFEPGQLITDNDDSDIQNDILLDQRNALEGGLYISNEQKINDKLTLNYGLRFSTFSAIGADTIRTYDNDNNIIDETYYGEGEFYKTYYGFEPRFAATYLIDEKSSLKASYNRQYQYMHLLSNSSSGTPTDVWMPAGENILPGIADQVSLGYYRNFDDNKWQFSTEVYYRDLQNQVDYEDGADILLNPDVESQLVFGDGRAYGIEFLLRKQVGKFTGWASYTLSKTERQFAEINNGEWFSARQDRTHDISLVGTYQINPKWSVSANWVYYTGDAITFPGGKYEVDGNTVFLYTERNGGRMPDYHRLDLGATYTTHNSKKFKSDLNFSIYNAYARKNAYTISFEDNIETGESEAVMTYLFSIVPSVTWNFQF
jgi:hypothetical protein